MFLKTFPLIINSCQYYEKVYLYQSVQIRCVRKFYYIQKYDGY